MKKILTIIGLAAASLAGVNAAVIFSENFGTLADGTALTTSNTNFTYVRASTGASPILEAQNPSVFGTGASGLLLATTTSLTGVGVTSGTYTAFDVGTLSFDLRTPGANGTLFFGVGTGATTFTNNSTFSTNDLTAGFQILNGQLQTRSGGAWVSVGSALSTSTNYTISAVFNGSASSVVYGSNTVAAGKADFFINGSLFGDDIGIQDAVSASAFRFYSVSNVASNPWQIDNIVLNNTAVPEPQTWALIGIGSAFMLWNLRRRREIKL